MLCSEKDRVEHHSAPSLELFDIYKFYGMNFGCYAGYDATLVIIYCKLHQN